MTIINSTVLNNYVNDRDYAPYCGSCDSNTRTKLRDGQFECCDCGWRSDFPNGLLHKVSFGKFYELRSNQGTLIGIATTRKDAVEALVDFDTIDKIIERINN